MKIIALQASNIKKLTAVSITPDGASVVLAGDNGAGKSSILDAIAYALGGTADVCDQPIRRGESEAEVICKLPGLTVTRKFSAGGSSTLKVTDADGKRQSSPQAILDALVGNLAFDPLEFSRLKPDAQAETLRALVGIDFNKLNAESLQVYNDRLLVGREADILKGKLFKNLPTPGLPAEEISATDALAGKNAAVAQNKANAIERAILQQIQEDQGRNSIERERLTRVIRDLEDRLTVAKQEIESVTTRSKACAEQWNTQHEVVRKLVDTDASVFDAQIVEASKMNEAIRRNRELEAQTAECKSKDAAYASATARLEQIDSEKKKLLAAVKFPLPELSFSETGGVTYNGFPFAQASDGEKLRVSVAIGMALNPKLRVIFIRDGSLLDSNGLRTVADLAAVNDYQVWIEDARSVDPTAVIIEDGHVKAP